MKDVDTRPSQNWWSYQGWWIYGLAGGATLFAMTLANAIASIPRLFVEKVSWAELAVLPFLVFAVGFACGSVVGMLRGISLRAGWIGDGFIGLLVGILYFFCFMFWFDRPMALGRTPGREGWLLFGGFTGLAPGLMIGHDIRRDAAARARDGLAESSQTGVQPDITGEK
jgi:hypothetical protein